MLRSLYVAGSLDALRDVLGDLQLASPDRELDVVVVPTAAAFIGVSEAAVATAHVCDEFDVRVEALMVTDRTSAHEPYFVRRLGEADLVVICEGSALHARTVWRNTPVGEALSTAKCVAAIGSVATVLGEVMIDPRGGAPTTGMGLCRGVAFSPPSSDEQLSRTRHLVTEETALVVVGPRGVLHGDGETWRILQGDDVVVTRGSDVARLGLGDRH